MITLISACIVIGCLNDVPLIVSNNPVRSYLTPIHKPKVDRSQFSCYIDGEFYKSCPN